MSAKVSPFIISEKKKPTLKGKRLTEAIERYETLGIFEQQKNSMIKSMGRSLNYQYNMLIALQQQMVCLEVKIKVLEEMIRRK